MSVREASKIIGAGHMQVKYWVSMYERYGKSGLRMRNFSYSGEFKTKVIEDMYKNRLTLYDTALKYIILILYYIQFRAGTTSYNNDRTKLSLNVLSPIKYRMMITINI